MASRRIIIKILNKTILGTLLGVLTFGSLMAIPIGHASAAPVAPGGGSSSPAPVNLFDSLNPDQQAIIWGSIQAATSSSSQCLFPSGAAPHIITDGNWLAGTDVIVGHQVAPDIGTVNCGNENNWFKNLLDAAGFAGDYQTPAKKIFGAPDAAGTIWPLPGAKAALKTIFAQAFFSSSSMPATAPDYLAYQILLANFIAPAACNAQAVADGLTTNAVTALHDKTAHPDRTFVNVPIYVQGASAPKLTTYYYDDSTAAISVGLGLNISGGGSPGVLQCKTIANQLHNSKYAAARLAYALAFPTTAGAPSSPTANPGDLAINCGTRLAVILNPLNWIMCPIVEGLATIVKTLDAGINNMLTINTNNIFVTNPQYKTAWSHMRTYALIFLVIATLIIVISQALGFEILDAYTVRKVLPRLLISAIAITVSWQFMLFFVTLSNDLGNGIRAIIYAPFSSLIGTTLNLGGGGLFIADLIGAGAIVALGVPGLLSFIATAALAVAVAFLVLVVRQIVIVLLILVAPIAIVCYILPNTKKVFDMWWDSFAKGLMMFPIIAAFIAVGRVGAAVASSQGGGINSFIAFVSYFAPYFLIPLTFKLAGGALGSLGGMVNDRGRGGFDRLKNYRKNTIATRGRNLKAGSLYQDRGVGKVINSAGRRSAVGMRGRFGVGARGRAALGIATTANNDETLKNNRMLYELRNNDYANAVMAFSGGTSGGAKDAATDLFGDDEATKNRAFAAASAVGFSRQNAAAALQTTAQNKSRAVEAGGIDIVQNGVNRLAGGNASEAAGISYGYQYFSREAGRGDLGGNYMNPRVQARGAALAAASPGMTLQEGVRHANALDGMGRTEIPALLRGFPAQMNQYSETLTHMLANGDADEKNLAATRMLELQKNISYASGDNQKTINDLLQAHVTYGNKPDGTASDSIEQQLATAAGGTVTAIELSRGARTMDRDYGPTPGDRPGGPGDLNDVGGFLPHA